MAKTENESVIDAIGHFLDAGVYTAANLPRYIGGDGELVVKEYGGPKGMLLILR